MPREGSHQKGRRLLVESRLIVKAVTERHVSARCRGDGGEVYTLAADSAGWSYSCPARGTCSHLVALRLVVLQPLPMGTGPNGPTERNHR